MSEDAFDIVVLGGGSGGYAAALRARELGRTVALIERDQVGGTCLHRGCVPTKALLHSGEVADVVRNAAHHGVSASFEAIEMAAVHDYRRKIVSKKHAGLTGLLAARGVVTVIGDGYLEPGLQVRVGDRVLSASDIVLATGGRTRELPDVPLGGRVLSSDTALELDEVPASVVILGGGVIGVEFASIWRSFGAEVTIIEPLARLLPSEDEASSAALLRAFRKRGIT
ncbi:MAG: FAD-dependent oxidoreductase, partial [Micrococcales bacterium]|nr:FAD-dependent oxidoreductase [Micrococcales bacterium]